jgi:N-methylhydantoinase B
MSAQPSFNETARDTEQFDLFTIEIIQNTLQAICDEMFVAMRKTAMSAIIYEVLDMGTAIVDPKGNLACTGAGIPLFVAGLDKAVLFMIRKCEAEGIEIEPGDVFVTNDPYNGGITHLNDVVFLMPVFVDGSIVAWTADIAHWNDVGGMVPGSMAPTATEIFQEGLRLPGVKIIAKGKPNEPLIEVMKINSRMPEFLEGDLWAGIAAVRVGARRLEEVVRKYGSSIFREAIRRYLDYGERMTLEALKNLPKGRFTYREEQDSGRVYSCAIEIRDDAFIVDVEDNPREPGPYNISRDASLLAAQLLLKAVSDPSPICNGGNFRPLKFLTKRGTVFDPEEPAAHGVYYETVLRLYDLLWRCLASHLPHMLPAGHYASMCATVLGGIHPDTGRPYTIVEPQLGGWGGHAKNDGSTAVFSGFHGMTFNCPVEINEARNGLFVERLELNPDPGGEGRQRGGKGIRADYRIRAAGGFLTCFYTRSKFPPWGLAGGLDGSPNYVEIRRADGTVERHAEMTNFGLQQEDVVRIVTGNGGGYGDPKERSRDKIRDDLKNGYVTESRAKAVYGYDGSLT